MPEEEEEEDCYRINNPQRPLILDERHIAATSRLDSAVSMIELIDDNVLLARLVSAINVESEHALEEGDLDDSGVESRVVAGFKSKDRGSVITKEILARRWGIGLETAHRTLTATTQLGVRRIPHTHILSIDVSGPVKRTSASLI
jgi:hypothetical protein